MLQTGTLRKRTRRTIVKVNAHSPYNENLDTDNISSIWSFSRTTQVNRTMQNRQDGLNPNASSNYQNKRITRNPIYLSGDFDVEAFHKENRSSPYSNKSSRNQPEHKNKSHTRPHLLRDAWYTRIRIIIFFSMLCFNVPWAWNRKTHRIDRWNPFMVRIWKLYWYFVTAQSTFMLIYHLYCWNGMYSQNLESYRPFFAYSVMVYWYVFHLAYKTSMFLYENQIRQYINQLQDFNEDYVEKYLMYADNDIDVGSAKLIVNFSVPVGAFQIANSLFFFVTMPYMPYYLTSMINPRPWWALLPGVIQELTLVGQGVMTYVTIAWMQIAHTSSIQFWLTEMHKDNSTIYTTDELRSIRVAIPSYRSLQLLCNRYNECMSEWCIPAWKFAVALGFIPCGFLCIRSMNKVFIEEFPGSLLYPFGVANCITMGYGCLAMSAEMYDSANSYIKSWSRTKQKDFQRILLSYPTLKVKVGRYYFITKITMITFFQVITGYVINSLLTFP